MNDHYAANLQELSDDDLIAALDNIRESMPNDDFARNWPHWDEFNSISDEIASRAESKGWHLELRD